VSISRKASANPRIASSTITAAASKAKAIKGDQNVKAEKMTAPPLGFEELFLALAKSAH
jgi:hypothetical protein